MVSCGYARANPHPNEEGPLAAPRSKGWKENTGRNEGHLGMRLAVPGEGLGTVVDVLECVARGGIWWRKGVDFMHSRCCRYENWGPQFHVTSAVCPKAVAGI